MSFFPRFTGPTGGWTPSVSLPPGTSPVGGATIEIEVSEVPADEGWPPLETEGSFESLHRLTIDLRPAPGKEPDREA